MEKGYSRRDMLRLSASVGAALLAAGGGVALTPRTTTAAASAITASSAAAISSPSTHVAAVGASGSDLRRMLAFIPDRQDLVQLGITFANVGAVKELYGFADVRSYDDFQAKNPSSSDFIRLFHGCWLSNAAGVDFFDILRGLAGYDLFQIDREISFLSPDDGYSRLEGPFDGDAISTALSKDGYTTATYQGASFFTVRGDNGIDFNDPISAEMVDTLDRVAADNTRLTSAPTTALMQAALDAELQLTPTLDANPTWQALADAFSTVLSMATFAPNNQLADPRLTDTGRAQIKTWGELHDAELIAMGYSDDGAGALTVHVARVYATPADANTDAEELVTRIQGYISLQSREPIVPSLVTDVTSRVVTSGGKGVLVADMLQAPHGVGPSLWRGMLTNKDTLFLATGSPG